MIELPQEALLANQKKLIHNIKLFFPNEEIVTLADLVKNISNCPSVRGGNKGKLDFLDYYEIGLRDCNKDGVIEFDPKTKKDLGAANKIMVQKYALHQNDLLLPYRAAKHMKIARVAKEYDFPIVTNTSTIRIQMHKESTTEMSFYIQAYLDLPYVQHYLIPDSRCNHGKRPSIKIRYLQELPIPKFQINSNIDYQNIFTTHSQMASIAQEIYQYSSMLNYNIRIQKETTAHLFKNSTSNIENISYNKELKNKMITFLDKLKQLENISYKLNKDFYEIFKGIYPHRNMVNFQNRQ